MIPYKTFYIFILFYFQNTFLRNCPSAIHSFGMPTKTLNKDRKDIQKHYLIYNS